MLNEKNQNKTKLNKTKNKNKTKQNKQKNKQTNTFLLFPTLVT